MNRTHHPHARRTNLTVSGVLSDPGRRVRLTVLRFPSFGVQHRVLSDGPQLTPKLERQQGDGSPFRRHSVLFSSFPETFDRVSAICEAALRDAWPTRRSGGFGNLRLYSADSSIRARRPSNEAQEGAGPDAWPEAEVRARVQWKIIKVRLIHHYCDYRHCYCCCNSRSKRRRDVW